MKTLQYLLVLAGIFTVFVRGDSLDNGLGDSDTGDDDVIVIGEQPPPTNGTEQDDRALLRCYCGRNRYGFDEIPGSDNSTDEEKIVGGFRITNAYDPWMTQVIRGSSFVCSGSVISDRYILTAAHCLYGSSGHYSRYPYPPSYFKARLDATLLNQGGQIYSVVSHTMLTSYYNRRRQGVFNIHIGDWAVLKVSRQIPLTSGNIRPICLPYFSSRTYNRRIGRITGWGAESHSGGASAHLKQGYSYALDPYTCRRYSPYRTTYTGEMCGLPIYRHGICFGDSGGPFSYIYSGRDYVVGVASYILGSCATATNRPNVFADVTVYDYIIRRVISRDSNMCR